MSIAVLAAVPHRAWQIKKAAVRHSSRHRAARAPPVAAPRTKQHPFPFQEIKHT
ncbi:hypothetical protein OG983_23425 [Streptomyces jietaisiensis]|uniref:hypothetical protein n=1 Tax=Streptomyces griseoaurantiacus TaxID=68213 RepID=UPI002E3659CA|nr:hypothetical protein [Streptomyces jietaisiensis]